MLTFIDHFLGTPLDGESIARFSHIYSSAARRGPDINAGTVFQGLWFHLCLSASCLYVRTPDRISQCHCTRLSEVLLWGSFFSSFF